MNNECWSLTTKICIARVDDLEQRVPRDGVESHVAFVRRGADAMGGQDPDTLDWAIEEARPLTVYIRSNEISTFATRDSRLSKNLWLQQILLLILQYYHSGAS